MFFWNSHHERFFQQHQTWAISVRNTKHAQQNHHTIPVRTCRQCCSSRVRGGGKPLLINPISEANNPTPAPTPPAATPPAATPPSSGSYKQVTKELLEATCPKSPDVLFGSTAGTWWQCLKGYKFVGYTNIFSKERCEVAFGDNSVQYTTNSERFVNNNLRGTIAPLTYYFKAEEKSVRFIAGAIGASAGNSINIENDSTFESYSLLNKIEISFIKKGEASQSRTCLLPKL